MGSFSIWHLAVVLCVIGAFSFLIAVVIRSSRKAAYTFKPIAGLAKWLTRVVALTMLLGIIAWGFHLLELGILTELRSGVTPELVAAFEANTDRMNTLGVFMILPVITATVLGFCWIYRASANLWARKGEELSFSPGGAIGFYFVPILNLFMPFQALKEICGRSAVDADDGATVSKGLLGLWWFLFLAAWVARLAKNNLNRHSETITDFLSANYAAQAELVFLMPLSVVFLIIVRRVSRLQSLSAAHSSSR